MRILRHYLLREHASPFFVTLGGLTAVLLLGYLIKFADLVISKGVNPIDLLRLIVYLVPYMISFTIPMACLIAMVLAFNRFRSDYEIIAMRASGVSPAKLIMPILTIGLIISAILFILNDRVVPATHYAFRKQIKAIGIKQPTAYLEAGTFIKEFEPYVIFVYQIKDKVMHNIRIYEPQVSGPTRTIIADRAEFQRLPEKTGVQLNLYDGTLDERDPTRPGSFYKASFSVYRMNLDTNEDDPDRIGKKMKELTFNELLAEEQKLQSQEIDATPVTLELHRKMAASFAPLVFVLFGLVLGLSSPRHEKLTTYVWVLLIFMVYYLSTVGMNALVLKGWCPPAVAMWTPNAVSLFLCFVLLSIIVRR